MKRVTSFLALLMGVSASAAMAQSQSVFGGFSYLRGATDLFSGQTDTPSLLGWQASYTRQLTPRFGLTGEFGGNYGPVSRSNGYYGYSTPNYMQHTVLGGPEFAILKTGKFQVNVRALAGIARANQPYAEYLTGYYDYYGHGSGTTAFAAAFGGSADLAISPHVSIRLLQPEYLVTRFDNAFQDNLRVSAGILFKFGD